MIPASMRMRQTTNFPTRLPRRERKRGVGGGFCPASAGEPITIGRFARIRFRSRYPEKGAFSLPIRAVPDIRGSASSRCRTHVPWLAAIAQLVEHVIRNDG